MKLFIIGKVFKICWQCWIDGSWCPFAIKLLTIGNIFMIFLMSIISFIWK